VSYVNRGLVSSQGKISIVDRMKKRSGYDLNTTTLLLERKVNLFLWHEDDHS